MNTLNAELRRPEAIARRAIVFRTFRSLARLPVVDRPSSRVGVGKAYSTYLGPHELSTDGPVTVLLGQYGRAKSPIEAPAPINYFSVTLEAGESWSYKPSPGHVVAWAAVSAGSLRSPNEGMEFHVLLRHIRFSPQR